MAKYDYIQVYDWMRIVYNLTGYELLVYAYIYNLVEMTPVELEAYTGLDKKKLNNALKSLEDDGLIKWRKIKNKSGQEIPKEQSILFYANPEFCL